MHPQTTVITTPQALTAAAWIRRHAEIGTDTVEQHLAPNGDLILTHAGRALAIPPNGMTHPLRQRLVALAPDNTCVPVTAHDPSGQTLAPPRHVVVARCRATSEWQACNRSGGSSSSLAAARDRLVDRYGWADAVVAPVLSEGR